MSELLVVVNNVPQSFDFSTTTLVSSANISDGVDTYFKHLSYFHQYFAWYDYILFLVMLLASVAIGLYHGCYGIRNRTTEEYLMGGRSMGVWPITISLIAGHTSGMTITGLPADIYMYGLTFTFCLLSYILASLIIAYVLMPVFFQLKLSSTYEYLEKRFDRRCRKYASAVFTMQILMHLPVVVYTPALAFETVTGINLHLTTTLICSVCILYTALGGFRAVVWTDALQFVVTFVTLITVFILGVQGSGGFAEVWKIAKENKRLEISFDFDPTNRETFWAFILGYTMYLVGVDGVNHSCVQKWLAVKTYKESVQAVFGYAIGMGLRDIVIILTGLAMFTRYSGCDPVTTKQVNKKDQLMPYFVMDMSEKIPGLGGLFIAGLFCGELSTLSAHLNSVVSTIYEDFLKNWLNKKNNPKWTYAILKLTSVIIGIMVFGMVFVIENLGGIFNISIIFMSIAYGPILAMFLMGTLFPTANAKGAFSGFLIAFGVGLIMAVGNKYYSLYVGIELSPTKPVSIDRCPFPTNVSLVDTDNSTEFTTNAADFQPFYLFRIAFYWYTLITAFTGIVSGLVISHFTGKNDPPIHKDLLSPLVHSWCVKNESELPEYPGEDTAMMDFRVIGNQIPTNPITKLED